LILDESQNREIAGFLDRISSEECLADTISRHLEKVLSKIEASKSKSRSSGVFKSLDEFAIRPLSAQLQTRQEARSKLISVWPECFSRSLGSESMGQGVGRIFDLTQSALLNRHLIFTLADAILQTLLEES
jgi:hypothetical protein